VSTETETYIKDKDNNRASVEFWGSEEAARKSLTTLTNCADCVNCSDCSRCMHCKRCKGCLYCESCLACLFCAYCLVCSHCTRCSHRWGDADADRAGSTVPPIIPTIENIHKAIYSAATSPGALNMSAWHSCKNSHCRAGWAIALAGKHGKKLEDVYGIILAALMIYDASDPSFKINYMRFFDNNAEALADMKRLAEG
jgi:hypothetical protein